MLPRLVLSIVPIYVPPLWVAYSSNKSMKLSKRLIEEYEHKEVLNKTFEGLSNQIKNIKDRDESQTLMNRLLSNMLYASAENPGKLITDYNKSDHPIMDILDKSVLLGGAIEKLESLPGMSRIVGLLEMKKNKLYDGANAKVEKTAKFNGRE
jgi:hypothetical protein